MAASRNATTTLAAIKLGIFTATSIFVTAVLAIIMGSFSFSGHHEYKALFSSASMIKSGDDVRVAGVAVGQVKDVKIYHRSAAEITFEVNSDVPVSTASRAEVRFLNLVGNRYMSLTQGDSGAPRLKDGATIPMSHTEPALNLTELFNGFQPLFQVLSPDDVNTLSMNLVRVLQGEGGTVGQLLSNTASLTSTLADRDQLIGSVITNLNTMLATVDSRHDQLNNLIIQLKVFLGKVSTDRKAIGDSLSNLSGLTAQLASLLTQTRPYLKTDIAELRRVMTILNRPQNRDLLDKTLKVLPVMLERQARSGTYGSWYNYYLCDFSGSIILPKLPDVPGLNQLRNELKNMEFHSTAKRCA